MSLCTFRQKHVACILLMITLVTSTSFAAESDVEAVPTVVVVVGAEGAPAYQKLFAEWANRWTEAATLAKANIVSIGRNPPVDPNGPTDRELLHTAMMAAAKEASAELWIVLIGHGTFDRREARFNLRGPDCSAKELAEWVKPLTRPVAIVNCASASAPFLNALAGPNRVVIAATKSGAEQNFARFGDFLSKSIADPTADLDKDDQVSLWEAYLAASRRTAEFYSTDGRLMTEHALLDDSGDGLGVRADQFRGLIPIEETKDGKPLDGQKAHQWHLVKNSTDSALPPDVLKKRNDLESAILKLRDQKSKLEASEYFRQLERLLVELAELHESVEK